MDRAPERASDASTVGDPFQAPDPYAGAEARVRTLLDDASDGDIDAYLDAFSGRLRARLEREIAETGPRGLRRGSAQGRRDAQGPRRVRPAGRRSRRRARVVVETVYPDRNERQTFRVERASADDTWRVADVELVRTHQPKAKYGSLATFGGPEGVPVPTEPGASAGPAAATAPPETP